MRVYINNRDLLTWPAAMADKIASLGHDPIIIDNDSSYEPLLDWYSKTPYDVIRLEKNLGFRAFWLMDGNYKDKEDYVVTDPDLDLSDIPDDWEDVLREGLRLYGGKCGFSLDETRMPTKNPAYTEDFIDLYGPEQNPNVWSSAYRTDKCPYHLFPVDTTFAVYAKGSGPSISGVRSGRPYTVRHLPWHIVLDKYDEDSLQIPMDDELYHYYTNASVHSTTKLRLEPMLTKYALRKAGMHNVG